MSIDRKDWRQRTRYPSEKHPKQSLSPQEIVRQNGRCAREAEPSAILWDRLIKVVRFPASSSLCSH
jgi:hypothetical protein